MIINNERVHGSNIVYYQIQLIRAKSDHESPKYGKFEIPALYQFEKIIIIINHTPYCLKHAVLLLF
jgi:hypothetical protein